MMWVSLALASMAAPLPPTDNYGEPFEQSVPGPVREFVIQRQGCEHFSGEPTGGDPGRDAFLAREVERLCPGLERRWRLLMKRYGSNPALAQLIGSEAP